MNPTLVQAQKFEEFIISVLKQICIKENKPIIVEADLNNLYKNNVLKDYPIIFNKVLKREVRFDVFLPNGFLHFNKPVFVEIKYGNYKKTFDDLCPDFGEHISLYIVKSNNNFNKNIRQLNNNEIIVWDEEYIGGWEKEYAVDYYGLYSSNIPEDNLIEFFNKNEANKKLLRKQIQENNLSLSLGAGVSIDFGSFKWDLLIKQFYNEIQKDGKINDIIGVQEKIGGTNIINGQFTEDNLKDFMKSLYDGLYSKYNPNQIYSFSTISHLIPLIKKLKDNRRFNIITYNYDDFLEQLLSRERIQYNTLYNEDIVVDDRLSIYHPHGYLPYNTNKTLFPEYKKNIVFSEGEYHKLYNNPYAWATILQYFLYRESSFLFVGCSLTDPNLRRILSSTKIKGRMHYAFMLTDNLSKIDQFIVHKHFMQMGVECIWFDSINDMKNEVDTL